MATRESGGYAALLAAIAVLLFIIGALVVNVFAEVPYPKGRTPEAREVTQDVREFIEQCPVGTRVYSRYHRQVTTNLEANKLTLVCVFMTKGKET